MSWREFTGTRELIEEGDQVRYKLHTKWFPTKDVCHNTMTHLWPNYRFRTKRPLTEQFDDAANLVVKESLITELEAEVERLRKEIIFRENMDALSQEVWGEMKSEFETLKKLTEDCLNVIRVYCPTYYQDAMERFNKTDK
jgi:hypothetical protein